MRDLLKRFPHLYYCYECEGKVSVTVTGAEPIITRKCGHDTAPVIAPRKALMWAGEGEPSLRFRLRVWFGQSASALTGRCV